MVNEKIKTFFNFLDKLFKVPRSYKLNHVNDDSDVISKAESETRIFCIIFVLGLFLNLGGSFVISILINLTTESPRYEIIETEYGEQTCPKRILGNCAQPVIKKKSVVKLVSVIEVSM